MSFLRKRLGTGEVLGEEPLDLPARTLRTTRGLVDGRREQLVAAAGSTSADVPGAAHAAEHASIGLLPLFATCDRWDIGGVSTALHPDTGLPTVFVYDGHPGGAGFAERGFARGARLAAARRGSAIARASAPTGCPSCVQSPKCGNGNEPLDKAGAAAAARRAARRRRLTCTAAGSAEGPARAGPAPVGTTARRHEAARSAVTCTAQPSTGQDATSSGLSRRDPAAARHGPPRRGPRRRARPDQPRVGRPRPRIGQPGVDAAAAATRAPTRRPESEHEAVAEPTSRSWRPQDADHGRSSGAATPVPLTKNRAAAARRPAQGPVRGPSTRIEAPVVAHHDGEPAGPSRRAVASMVEAGSSRAAARAAARAAS